MGSGGREAPDDGAEVGDEVLGAIEDDQHAGVAQTLAQHAYRVEVAGVRAGADAAQAQGGAYGREDLVGAPQRRELHEPRSVGHAVEE